MLAQAKHVLVVAHERPDGDAIGSTLGLGMALDDLGVRATLFNVDTPPYNLMFLDGVERLTSTLHPSERPDVTVVLDCSERSRVGERFPEHGWGDTIICLDHHATHDPDFPDIFVHDVEACSTGELVYRLLCEIGTPLTPEISRALFCAVQTDTGSFRYQNTTTETMELASALLRTRINAWDVSAGVYEQQPAQRLHLLTHVLQTLQISSSGKLASLCVSEEMFTRTATDSTHIDGFINYARSIAGVEVATMISGDDRDGYRVSMRSSGSVNVAAVAEQFGGGGHFNAAGCRIEGTLDDVRARLEAALQAVL